MRYGRILLLGVLLASAPVHAQTQQAPVQNPQNTLQQVNPPVQSTATANSTGGISVQNQDLAGLEVVKSYPVPNTLTFSTDQNFFFTDNAFLTKNQTVSSFGYNGRLRASYVPYSTRDWTPSLSFEQQFVRYDHTSVLDFDSQTAQIASHYDIVKDKTLSWDASYSLQRLYTGRLNAGEFYKESFLDDSINYIKILSQDDHLFFVASYEIGWRLTDPTRYSRIDNALVASLVYMPTPQVRIQPYFRPAIYEYLDDQEIDYNTASLVSRSRTDYDFSTGFNVSYSPCKWVSFNANLNWTGNYSNVGFREYTATTPGIGISGSIGFW